MADHAATVAHDDHGHGTDHVKIYMRVFFSLALLTAIEYFYARIFKDAFTALVLGLLTWALIKAALVGLYFMHVKYEGRWIYALIVPACVLAIFLMVMLYPDTVLRENASEVMVAEQEAEEEGDEMPHAVSVPSGMDAPAGAAEHK